MDTACLDAQFRVLGRDRSRSPSRSRSTSRSTGGETLSAGRERGRGDGDGGHDAGGSGAPAAASARAPAAAAAASSPRGGGGGGGGGGACGSMSENQGGDEVEDYGGGGGKPLALRRLPREASSTSDVRSRLSGASPGMTGGATAVVAVATKVGKVCFGSAVNTRIFFVLNVELAPPRYRLIVRFMFCFFSVRTGHDSSVRPPRQRVTMSVILLPLFSLGGHPPRSFPPSLLPALPPCLPPSR